MDVLNTTDLRALLNEYGIRPKRHLGQNFLVSKKILHQILDTADLSADDVVLEIGGGAGALSIPLAEHVKKLIIIERDRNLCKILEQQVGRLPHVEIRCEDAKRLDYQDLPHGYRIVSNLPYSVGLVILRSAFESSNPPKNAFVMLQKEVGERLLSQPPERSLAGAAMQTIVSMQKLFIIPASATWPKPDVDSVYMSFVPREGLSNTQRSAMLRAIKTGYMHPRKKVLRNLVDATSLASLARDCAIDENARASELTDTQWICVAEWQLAR